MLTYVKKDPDQVLEHLVNLQDVNRLLDLGKLLASILTDEELKALHDAITTNSAPKSLSSSEKIGNTGVS